jgi:hypothetical protein
MSENVSIQITYAGPALENNEMDVRELAPALVAVADLLQEANSLINGGGTRVDVNVHGSFKSGSFSIDFNIVQNIYQDILRLFTSDGVTTAVNLLTLIGFTGAGVNGLIGLLKNLKSRKIQKIEDIDNSHIRIHITQEETIDVDPRVLDLYRSQRVRDALDKVIAVPLGRTGIDEFRVTYPGEHEPVIVTKQETQFFELPLLGDELLGENITEAYLQLVNIAFKEDNKWRFSRGESVFYAVVADDKFLAGVNRNEILFSKDDILRVRLLAKDILTDKGIRTEYTVLEVLEHRSAARQLKLPMEHDNDD